MTTAINPEIESAMNRLMEKSVAFQAESEPTRLESVRFDVLQKMKSQGFPVRHIGKLDSMFGPSLEKAESLKERAFNDALLLLFGDRGPGKTQIATWWAYQRGLAGKFVGWYVKCTDLYSEIAATWDKKSKVDEEDVLKKYRTTKFLVIDELQDIGTSDWHRRLLVNLIDHRYDDMLTTVLIANLSEDAANKEINPSIISRANETGGMIECKWESYRIGK